jgi:hypothetical protein
VGGKLARQARQDFRRLVEMGDAHGEHHPPRQDDLAIVEGDPVAGLGRLKALDGARLQHRREPALEVEAIVQEGVQADRDRQVVIVDAPAGAVGRQGVVRRGRRQARGEAVRLEQHAARHVLPPSGERRSEYPEIRAQPRQMSADGEAVGPRAHDNDVCNHVNSTPPV